MSASRSLRPLAFALPLVLAASAAGAQKPLPADSLELGRRFAAWFLSGTVDSLTAHMAPNVVESLGGRAGLLEGRAMVERRAGTELNLIDERFAWRNGQRQYWRRMQMSVLDEPFVLRFVMLPDGSIAGMGMGPESATPPADSGGVAIIKP